MANTLATAYCTTLAGRVISLQTNIELLTSDPTSLPSSSSSSTTLCPSLVSLLCAHTLRSGDQQGALRIEIASQFRAVVVLHEPLLARKSRITFLHYQFILVLIDGQAFARRAVMQLFCALTICPELQIMHCCTCNIRYYLYN